MEQPGEIRGNPAIEEAAIRHVLDLERAEGRRARDARGSGVGGAGDIEGEDRVIEVKGFSGWGLRTGGVLLFTPGQIAEGLRNPNYYVYIVENVAQGDPAKFEVRVLHGEQLKRVFAGAKPQRFYVPVRSVDYAQLAVVNGPSEHSRLEIAASQPPVTRVGRVKPIRDRETGETYRSEYQAGKALYWLVDGDVQDRFVWYKIARAFPARFQTLNEEGAWVALDDPTAPSGSTR